MTLGQAALKWLLADPLVVTTLPNIYDDDQLGEFAEASDKPDLTRDELERVATLNATNFGVDEAPMTYKGTMSLRDVAVPLADPRANAYADVRRTHDQSLARPLARARKRRKKSRRSSRFRSGSRNKYELDKATGMMKLDRVLYSSVHYPGDYGFIPRTLHEDGDPLDVLVLVKEQTFSGCMIDVRPLGVLRMLDRGEPDDKILAVPLHDPYYEEFFDIADIPRHQLKEVEYFFSTYKDLEGKRVRDHGMGEERRGDACDHGFDRAV